MATPNPRSDARLEQMDGERRGTWQYLLTMAVRIRKDGRVLCAAMHPAEEGDCYVNDSVHYALSVEAKVLVTEPHEQHKDRGEWWWVNAIPASVEIDAFYLEKKTPLK